MAYLTMYILSLFQLVKRSSEKISNLNLFFILVLILFAAFRKGIGTDYESYVDIYYTFPQNIEIGYRVLNMIANKMGLGVSSVFFVSSAIMFFNIVKGAKNFKIDIGLTIFLYFCLYYLTHQYNVVRHGVAASFVFVAMSFIKENHYRKAVINIAIGSTFHIIAIVLLPILLLANKKISKMKYFIILLISILFVKFDFILVIVAFINKLFGNNVFTYKINYYINDYYSNISLQNTDYGFTLGFLARVLILLFIIVLPWYYKKREFEANILFFGVILMVALNNYGIFAERLVNILYMIEIVVLADIKRVFTTDKFTRFIVIVIIILYGSLFFFKILTGTEIDNNFQFLPYKSIFFQ